MGNNDSPREGDLAPGTTVGQYKVLRRIGSGGMAEVYEAKHAGLNKRVAIKTLRRQYAEDQTIVARFIREGQVASSIRHPNVVDVTDVGVIDGLPCLVMEYLEGQSLHALFKRRGPLPIAELTDLMLPVIAAVNEAHQQGVVHRDLKPANIFVTRGHTGELETKVLDFGISKVVNEPTPSGITTDSTFIGSPHYVAPELARGERVIDGRCDQYSIGVILYEGASGVRPFASRSETFMSLMYAIAQGDYPPLHDQVPGIPREFEAIVEKAMARATNDRYASLVGLGRALLQVAGERARLYWAPVFFGGQASVPPPTAPGAERVPPAMLEESSGTLGQSTSELDSSPRRIPRRRRSPLGWVAGGGLALLVACTIWVVARRLEPRTAPATPPPASTSFVASTSVTPKNARIELDGRQVGVGSFTRKLPLDGRRHSLSISAPGYDTLTLAFRDAPPPASVELVPSRALGAHKHAHAVHRGPQLIPGPVAR